MEQEKQSDSRILFNPSKKDAEDEELEENEDYVMDTDEENVEIDVENVFDDGMNIVKESRDDINEDRDVEMDDIKGNADCEGEKEYEELNNDDCNIHQQSVAVDKNTSLPLSMPKNWMQVERLKLLQRQMMKSNRMFLNTNNNTEAEISDHLTDVNNNSVQHDRKHNKILNIDIVQLQDESSTDCYSSDDDQLIIDEDKESSSDNSEGTGNYVGDAGFSDDSNNNAWRNKRTYPTKLEKQGRKELYEQLSVIREIKPDERDKKLLARKSIKEIDVGEVNRTVESPEKIDLGPLSVSAINDSLKNIIPLNIDETPEKNLPSSRSDDLNGKDSQGNTAKLVLRYPKKKKERKCYNVFQPFDYLCESYTVKRIPTTAEIETNDEAGMLRIDKRGEYLEQCDDGNMGASHNGKSPGLRLPFQGKMLTMSNSDHCLKSTPLKQENAKEANAIGEEENYQFKCKSETDVEANSKISESFQLDHHKRRENVLTDNGNEYEFSNSEELGKKGPHFSHSTNDKITNETAAKLKFKIVEKRNDLLNTLYKRKIELLEKEMELNKTKINVIEESQKNRDIWYSKFDLDHDDDLQDNCVTESLLKCWPHMCRGRKMVLLEKLKQANRRQDSNEYLVIKNSQSDGEIPSLQNGEDFDRKLKGGDIHKKSAASISQMKIHKDRDKDVIQNVRTDSVINVGNMKAPVGSKIFGSVKNTKSSKFATKYKPFLANTEKQGPSSAAIEVQSNLKYMTVPGVVPKGNGQQFIIAVTQPKQSHTSLIAPGRSGAQGLQAPVRIQKVTDSQSIIQDAKISSPASSAMVRHPLAFSQVMFSSNQPYLLYASPAQASAASKLSKNGPLMSSAKLSGPQVISSANLSLVTMPKSNYQALTAMASKGGGTDLKQNDIVKLSSGSSAQPRISHIEVVSERQNTLGKNQWQQTSQALIASQGTLGVRSICTSVGSGQTVQRPIPALLPCTGEPIMVPRTVIRFINPTTGKQVMVQCPMAYGKAQHSTLLAPMAVTKVSQPIKLESSDQTGKTTAKIVKYNKILENEPTVSASVIPLVKGTVPVSLFAGSINVSTSRIPPSKSYHPFSKANSLASTTVNAMSVQSPVYTSQVPVMVAKNSIKPALENITVAFQDQISKPIKLETPTTFDIKVSEAKNVNNSVYYSAISSRNDSTFTAVSSMDSCLMPLKKKKELSKHGQSSEKILLKDKSLLEYVGKDKDAIQNGDSKDSETNDRTESKTMCLPIRSPVPFLDFPARIVLSKKATQGQTKAKIVASPPKAKSDSGQTSEQLTKNGYLVSIESNKPAVSEQVSNAILISSMNQEPDNETSGFEMNEEKNAESNSQEDANEYNESSHSYESSDLEDYSSYLSTMQGTASSFKRKSQLIESYYTANGRKQFEESNMDPTPTFQIDGSFKSSTSEPSLNNEIPGLSTTKTSCESNGSSISHEVLSESQNLRETNAFQDQVRSIVTPTKDNKEWNSEAECRRIASTAECPSTGKKYIKSKFIILKGEIIDQWLEIKRKTGYGEMSDPDFVHYLLRLEERRQDMVTKGSSVACSGECSSPVVCKYAPLARAANLDLDVNNNSSCLPATSSHSDVQCTDLPDGQKQGSINIDGLSSPSSSSGTLSVGGSPDKSWSEVSASLSDEKRGKRPLDPTYMLSPPSAKKPRFFSDATQKQMRWAAQVLRDFLEQESICDTQFEQWDSAYLNNMLTVFYLYGRSRDGTAYSPDELQRVRRALSLYLASEMDSKAVSVSIALDEAFLSSNMTLARIMASRPVEVHRSEDFESASVISDEDLERMYESGAISDTNPTTLLRKVWFDITYHLYKGQFPLKVWRLLKKNHLALDSDQNGVFYTFSNHVFVSDKKNLKMYATPDNPDRCPVRSTSFYLSKLNPSCNDFFQHPKQTWSSRTAVWYCGRVIEEEKMNEMMINISGEAKLSMIYTNASVLATANYHNKDK